MLEPMLAGFDDTDTVDRHVEHDSESRGDALRARASLSCRCGRAKAPVRSRAGAVSKLSFMVPQVPGSMQAWEVLPGDVRGLRIERVVGGTQVTLPEFGLTTAIVFTSDTNLIVRFQEGTRSRRQQAAQWTYDLAVYSLDKILKVEAELERAGHTLQPTAST